LENPKGKRRGRRETESPEKQACGTKERQEEKGIKTKQRGREGTNSHWQKKRRRRCRNKKKEAK